MSNAISTARGPAVGIKDSRQTEKRKAALAWLTLPALFFFLVFAIIPLAGVLILSFAKWDGIGAIGAAGMDNWFSVLADPELYNALGLTFLIMIVSWLVQTPISLLLGVFTAGSQRYRAALAVLYFLPLLLSSAAVAIAFKALLDPNFGLATGLGLPFLAQDWLGVPQLALGLVIFVIAWQFVPFHTLIYQGGVRQIPKSLYEAAQIDGAGTIKQFFHITLPQLKYTIITSSTLMVVGSLTYFDLIFVLTGGGPGNSTPHPGAGHVPAGLPGQPHGPGKRRRRHSRHHRPRSCLVPPASWRQGQAGQPIGRFVG
ncbi:raffinose/stachyose/melibiose transport system permease protein [Arthrobacter sp. B2I5]|nr:raffinose/stachyose/melibiose transport system permease protein [Arthrobacter sp. B2I5]